MIQDKEDIIVSSEADVANGAVNFNIQENVSSTTIVTIKNTSDLENLIFRNCEMLKRIRVFRLNDSKNLTDGKKAVIIKPGDYHTFIELILFLRDFFQVLCNV